MSVGLWLLAAGLLLLPRRSAWPRGRERRRSAADERALPAVLDLVAVALRAGAAPGPALVAAATAADPALRAVLTDVGGQLTLGVDPARAWTPARTSPSLATVAVLATRSGTSGARLADAFAACAATLRDDAVAAGRRARHRARRGRSGRRARHPAPLTVPPRAADPAGHPPRAPHPISRAPHLRLASPSPVS